MSSIPTISKHEFIRRIGKRKHEDVALISTIERYLIKKRGFVFRMPGPGSPVILLVSGGIDSTVAWYLLLKEFTLDVYPLFVRTHRSHPQERSVAYFSALYRRIFAERYHDPFILTRDFLPREMTDIMRVRNIHGETLLDYYDVRHHRFDARMFVGLNAMSAQYGMLYSIYLMAKHRVSAQTLFCGVTARDGIGVPSQTLTSIRTTLLSLMYFYNMPVPQYASVFFEKETGWFASKRDIIALGARAGFPLEKTYSCYAGGRMHCGECMGCVSRRSEFVRAGILDRTRYASDLRRTLAIFPPVSILKRGLRKIMREVRGKCPRRDTTKNLKTSG